MSNFYELFRLTLWIDAPRYVSNAGKSNSNLIMLITKNLEL